MMLIFSTFITEEFVAHKANVNCLAMGHKSNQVLATGGDDKKVNLWAIGRQSCLMVGTIFNTFTYWSGPFVTVYLPNNM